MARPFSFLVSISCALLLAATPASAADPTADTGTGTGTGTGTESMDGKRIRGYDDYTGPYGQFGISIGATEGDRGIPDTDAQGGFNMTGGYRFLPWLSGEANFIFLRGELDNSNRDMTYFSFTFGPKFYPIALLEDRMIPEQFQPYMLVAIGGGEYDIENSGFDESTFIARFIWGVDWWLTDQFGAFVEGGYHVASESDIDGTGVFTFGGQVRF
jgi:hypothetical protein